MTRDEVRAQVRLVQPRRGGREPGPADQGWAQPRSKWSVSMQRTGNTELKGEFSTAASGAAAYWTMDYGKVCCLRIGHATLALPASWLPPCLVHNITSTPSSQVL